MNYKHVFCLEERGHRTASWPYNSDDKQAPASQGVPKNPHET